MSKTNSENVIFESGDTSVIGFMQCLEDIIHYIDGFTCGHHITLDTSSSGAANQNQNSLAQILVNSQEWSQTTDILHFSIVRRRRPSAEEMEDNLKEHKHVLIQAVFMPLQPNSTLKVQTCLLDLGGSRMMRAHNRGELRDLICASLVPAMRVFPLLHYLTLKSGKGMEPVPFPKALDSKVPQGVPELCMLLLLDRQLHISINANDQLVTWDDDEDLKTWNLGGWERYWTRRREAWNLFFRRCACSH
jgi:hypothetical protein